MWSWCLSLQFTYQIIGVDIREQGWSNHVFGLEVVCELVNPRKESGTVSRLALVEHKVGRQQHEEAELVALTLVTAMSWSNTNVGDINISTIFKFDS